MSCNTEVTDGPRCWRRPKESIVQRSPSNWPSSVWVWRAATLSVGSSTQTTTSLNVTSTCADLRQAMMRS